MDELKLEELARAEQREYLRKWRKANPEKVRKNNHAYWLKKAAAKLAAQQNGET